MDSKLQEGLSGVIKMIAELEGEETAENIRQMFIDNAENGIPEGPLELGFRDGTKATVNAGGEIYTSTRLPKVHTRRSTDGSRTLWPRPPWLGTWPKSSASTSCWRRSKRSPKRFTPTDKFQSERETHSALGVSSTGRAPDSESGGSGIVPQTPIQGNITWLDERAEGRLGTRR